jgi:hypothetical protein
MRSSVGRMVARKARRSRVRFLGSASKPRWCRCRVAAHNWSLHAGFSWFTRQNQHRTGTTWRPSHDAPSPRGLRWFTTKPSGLLGWATKPRPEARRAETGSGRAEKLRSGQHATWSRCLRWEEAKARWMRSRLMENFMCWPKGPCEGLSCNT